MNNKKSSREDYLEAILVLAQQSGDHVHAADIARRLEFTKPSVSAALAKLKGDGLIIVDADNHVRLTESGSLIASEILERHRILKDFFNNTLGVPERIAEEDACAAEHALSNETFRALKRFLSGI